MYRHGRTAVFVLSIICALLLGIIGGYFLNEYLRIQRLKSYYEPIILYDDIPEQYDYGVGPVRKDIIYYQPHGEAIWADQLEEIPTGNGTVIGEVYIDNEPAESLKLALILAPGRKTQTVIADTEGRFVISIKKGKYYFNGIAVYNQAHNLTERLLTNKIARFDFDDIGCPMDDENAFIEQFEKLAEEHGPEKASQLLAEQVEGVSDLFDKCPLVVGEKAVVLQPFRYRKPIKIISPSYNAIVTLEKLKFVWEAVPDAQSYKMSIDYVEKKGSTTSYHPILMCQGIEENYITYADVVQRNEYTDMYHSPALQPEKTYGVRVVAYDSNGNVATASGEDITAVYIFHTK